MALRKVKITQKEIEGIIDAKDMMEGMLGNGEDETGWKNAVEQMKKFIKRNNLGTIN